MDKNKRKIKSNRTIPVEDKLFNICFNLHIVIYMESCWLKKISWEDFMTTKYCSNCGVEIDSSTRYCSNCGAEQGSPSGYGQPYQRNVRKQKSAGLAAVLSFLVVGLGQVYNGEVGKGVLLFLGAVVSGILMYVLIGFITWIIIWFYAIYDAYNTANRINAGEII